MQIVDILNLLVPNVWTSITQLCATAVLFFALYRLAYKPVRKILDTRSEYEQNKLAEADALKAENEALRKQLEDELAKADVTARETIEKARTEGRRLKESLISEGKERKEQLLADAQADIDLQRSKMLDEVQRDIVDATISATEKLLNEKLDEAADMRIIDDFIKEVTKR
ncbi:MAG: F0F1 ATP synthase subunit B [Erysipelotrichaceae bacterium]|nr:F0F1 ATP synthase subunit B [Erysipelotrichaceae bacterium]